MRFFYPDLLAVGEDVQLTDAIFHHWCRVLRAQVGDCAILFNGMGGEYSVYLKHFDKKSACVQVAAFYPVDRTLPIQLVLGQVMSKGERMDYAIQKATELGVTSIQLLVSERCEMRLKYDRDQKKLQHWQAVAIAACEQCGLNRIPTVLAPVSLTDWVCRVEADLKLVLSVTDQHYDLPANSPSTIALLVGPEGGLTEDEVQFAQQQYFQPWTIGQRILRTETAPVAALAILSYLYDRQL